MYAHDVETVVADEGAAYGAAILAGVGAGRWASVDQANDAVVRVAASVSPEPNASSLLQQQYQVYRRIYPALRSIFEATPSAASL